MSDPVQIWAAASGQSKQRTVRAIWPELADALDGLTPDDPDVDQPLCHGCGAASGRLATGRAGDIPVCSPCAGRDPFNKMRQRKISAWKPGRAP